MVNVRWKYRWARYKNIRKIPNPTWDDEAES